MARRAGEACAALVAAARLSPGGVIVVADGSRPALQEFCAAPGQAFGVVERKLGVIRKPRG